ncbi:MULTISPECIES: glycine cleavage system protein GcvH [Planktothrix]|jgi:glycine cleavage system H protein|uniref:Glycine cleavage system H protein n=4 Tax=Planktothrix TaxID=54304 RepID=A0A073CDC1_PLAA1|nr:MULTISPECIES: glycine cleavage system protein GcvH [Planktothrix]MCF3607917.1 glycine cleavage system protein GcvH [Planktothrix agardhii 1033]CAD5910916.1 Glycine cleavage system H protein [Planktothrix rubescens]BBD55067.1 glycine cleavage system H protein [Planktothrix agardhii NIES-204]KEI66131.1 GcvH [Planktothrix agardhii NIVA-CYA 126/8]MBG0745313.1 glycine cleavage system protein GcvH [Planktothrix agardhii KL2]
MTSYPEDLRYLDSHEYVRLDGEIATIGITEFAVSQLGDIVFVELPNVEDEIEKGEKFGTVESVKAVEELISPIGGIVIECNTTLEDSPEILSDDPYGDGWLIKVKITDSSDLDDSLSAEQYQALV